MPYRSFLSLLFSLAFVDVASPAPSTETLPMADVRPGMKGIGRTVFGGSTIEEFAVTIIGTLENTGPGQNMILARLEGGPLQKTGVIAGMSGSPVYIDGKLVGAVAYGFPFAKEAIAGITPIREMIDATSVEGPRSTEARLLRARPHGASALRFPIDRESLVGSLTRARTRVWPSGRAADALPGALAGRPLAPLPMPLVFSGLDARTFEWAQGVFSAAGFAPAMGTASAAGAESSAPDLAPGGPVGFSLIDGDMDVSATGTITHIDGDRVYAFGHPFFNLGPIRFPMRKARVYSVFPSLYQSWKVSVPVGPAVGTIEQDRASAVLGRLGDVPRMIPISVSVATSRGQERQYSFRMVDDELMSPILAYLALSSVLETNERAFGTSTVRMSADLTLSNGRKVEIEDIFADGQPATQAAALLAAPVAYLLSNDFEPVSIASVDVSVSSYETIQSAVLERAWVERTGPLRPGSEASVHLLLRSYRGLAVNETVALKLPANARPGTYTLLVADAPTLTAVEQREMRQAFMPKDLDQLIRAINGLRRNNRLYFRLLQPDDGAIVAGEVLQSLPPSVLSVMGGTQGDGVIPMKTSSVWEHDLSTQYSVTGSRSLTVTLER